jgi:hypothetical protein
MHRFEEAAEYANLAGTGIPLMSRVQFADGFYTRNSEWMWASFVPADEAQSFATHPAELTNLSHLYPGAWGFANCISRVLIRHTDSANDARIGGFGLVGSTARWAGRPAGAADVMYDKFRWTLGTPYDLVYMRGAEMHLNEAEALLMQAAPDVEGARALVRSIIEARVDDGGVLADAVDGMNRDELLAEMKMQRRLEFWGEGIRFFDLKRRGETLDRTTSGAALANIHPQAHIITNPQSRHWTYRIPEREIRVNPIVVQNPEWDW